MSVEDLVNHITDQNFSKAEVSLNDILADKMNAALEQEKVAVANQIYNGVEQDEEQLEMDLDDEDLDEEETSEEEDQSEDESVEEDSED